MKRYGPKIFSLLLFFLFSWAAAPCPALAGGADTKIISVFPDVGEMVLIPAGEFIMGATEKDGLVGIEVDVAAMPARTVYLKSFYMDRYEVTVARYRRFMAATGRPPPQLYGPDYVAQYPAVSDDDPISDLTWYDADAYCRWTGKRLPTEEEWEKAARGTDGRRLPWGDEWKEDISNSMEYQVKRQKHKKRYTGTVTAVGSLKGDVSPYGVYDMGGNVMEWTSAWYKAYPGSELKRELFGETFKVLRGGSWMAPASPFSFSFNRFAVKPTEDDPHFGVRCAKDKD